MSTVSGPRPRSGVPRAFTDQVAPSENGRDPAVAGFPVDRRWPSEAVGRLGGDGSVEDPGMPHLAALVALVAPATA